jgi:hypothetical protein
MSQTLSTTAIHQVFDGLLAAQQVEAADLYRSFKPMLDANTIANPDDFYHALIYPHEQFLGALVQDVLQPASTEMKFLYLHSQFVDHHLSKLFERLEGRACCADKAGACIEVLAHFFRTGQAVEFNYEAKYTYHLPRTILRTHAERLAFYHALKNLYYGQPNEYLEQLQAFAAPSPS